MHIATIFQELQKFNFFYDTLKYVLLFFLFYSYENCDTEAFCEFAQDLTVTFGNNKFKPSYIWI